MPAAAIFDLDGTLLDTEPDFSLLLNSLLEKHKRLPVERDLVRRTVSSGARALVKLGFQLGDTDEQLPLLLEEFLNLYSELIPQTRADLFEDIAPMIAAVNAAGIPWGIMTNKPRRFSEPLLRHFAAFDTCLALRCPDDVCGGKPHPAGILSVCEALRVDPEQAVYIGDHPRDIEAASNAGMPGIAVRWGYLPEGSNIETWGARFIADTPRSLSDYLKHE